MTVQLSAAALESMKQFRPSIINSSAPTADARCISSRIVSVHVYGVDQSWRGWWPVMGAADAGHACSVASRANSMEFQASLFDRKLGPEVSDVASNISVTVEHCV